MKNDDIISICEKSKNQEKIKKKSGYIYHQSTSSKYIETMSKTQILKSIFLKFVKNY